MTTTDEPDRKTDEPMVELRGVTRSFADGLGRRTVLDGVDLAVRPGELVAVMGKSGSGKTTLLHLVAGLDRPDDGQVLVAGSYLSAADARDLSEMRRRVVGYIEQRFNLIDVLTAIENVTLPLELDGMKVRAARQIAMASLDAVGLADVAEVAGRPPLGWRATTSRDRAGPRRDATCRPRRRADRGARLAHG